ncbi:MAG: recombinase family protein [Hyphomicrobiaceae bacterium]
MKRKRCAIYTRKSSEEGLSQEFNSLDAQRESCEAYITSQRHEGWHLLQDAYNDGGFSGGTMDRPALVQLLSDIRAHRIDVVVVYKVDRLTRSLSDFARIVDIFDAHDVSFVSVTQSFNTTTSMGRLTLNVLLSFAQYEREVTGERIRDKISASKKKGLWMGGFLPIGYSANGRTLVVLPDQAQTIRLIFERYLELGTVRKLEAELLASGIHAPTRTAGTHRVFGGRPFTRAQLYKLLGNPIYCGEIRHKATRYPGQHEAIIPSDMFQRVQTLLALNTQGHRTGRGSKSPSLLAGLLVDKDGDTLVASHATKAGKRYRYYVARSLHEGGARRKQRDASRSGWRLPADQIEPLVIEAVRHRLLDTSWPIDTAKLLFASDQLLGAQIQFVTRASSELHGKLADGDPVGQREAMLKIIEKIDLDSDSLDEPGQLPEDPDATMIRAIARARRWLSDFVEGRYRTIQNIADAYATDPRYVARHLPLACLSPRIVEAIIAGRQPPELTTWSLLNRIDLPLDWDLQARRLSFNK